ncbi:hypothetical protein IWQ60_004855 [Tieghemiomyces parasiticus]|uniref:Inositol-pentakisphosphate 2-kinase n=1 Tax=Tieghemiomyces parasiticus TaxID=78921 RepID=A0A9W8DV56_9FUNG|nr:hypothetical protein IWQ60_004855 [Tieghemiomyces parasiticus]
MLDSVAAFQARLPLPATCLAPELWRYKNEGNANIILTSTSGDPRCRGLALRIRKCDVETGTTPGKTKAPRTTPGYAEELDYIHQVIAPLLGIEYMVPMHLLPVTPSFLTALDRRIQSDRPEARWHKCIDTRQEHVVITVDLTGHPYSGAAHSDFSPGPATFSVEIKWLSPRSVKRTTCRFCMKKYRDVDSSTDPPSSFCPMDLYSGSPARMESAFEALYTQPRNNLLLFRSDGSVMPRSAWEDLVHQFFERIIPVHTTLVSSSSILDTLLTPLLITILQQEPVLQRLSRWQQYLDTWDVEGLVALLSDFRSRDDGTKPAVNNLLDPPTAEEWAEVLATIDPETRPSLPRTTRELRHAVLKHLISATLKDCSVFISLWVNPASHRTVPAPTLDETEVGRTGFLKVRWNDRGYLEAEPNPDETTTGTRVFYTVHLIDLDPKPIKNLAKYYANDQAIVANYLSRNIRKYCE